MTEEIEQMKEMLLKSLYDYHFANNGASYTLRKAMLQAQPGSEEAITKMVNEGLATDTGQGTDQLVLSITPKGMEYIQNK